MNSTFFSLLALFFTVSHCLAAVDVTAEMLPYREKKETAPGEAQSTAKSMTPSKSSSNSQDKVISISLRNTTKKPENELVVRYWFIGRDMKTYKASVFDGGETSAQLKPNGTLNLTSDPAKGTVVRKAASPGKMGEATGVKIVGYGVQVIKAEKVVGEVFLESDHKKLVGAEGKKPGPFFKIVKPDADAQ